jgi:hypothetical protein
MIQIEYLPLVLTGIGLIASILYYANVNRNANKTRQLQILKGANLIGSYMNPLYLAEFTDFDEFEDKYDIFSNNEFGEAFFQYFNVLEELGVYVKEGLLDVKYVALIGGGAIIGLWEKFYCVHKGFRERHGKRWFSEAKHLYEKIKRYFEKYPELL